MKGSNKMKIIWPPADSQEVERLIKAGGIKKFMFKNEIGSATVLIAESRDHIYLAVGINHAGVIDDDAYDEWLKSIIVKYGDQRSFLVTECSHLLNA
jgi:hypothetical protein